MKNFLTEDPAVMRGSMDLSKLIPGNDYHCTVTVQVASGEIVTVRDFGAFVEILPGMDGLLHISEMADYRVAKVTDICNEGDFVTVKVIDIDNAGKIRLSRKAALKDMDQQ